MGSEPDLPPTIDIASAAQQAVALAEASADAAPAPDARPSILFCCPGSVLEITSGAALSLRTILAALVAKGMRAVALQATVFDSPQGGAHIMKAGEQQKDKPIWRTFIHGVEHLIVKTAHSQRRFMNCQEEETYVTLFRAEIRHRRPDMVFLWGGLVLERTIMREAREAGIPVVFYLVNPGYKDKSVFNDVSVVITDTEATAQLYKERHGLDCIPVGKFINSDEIKVKVPRKPDYITFINPSFEKGVSVFLPLAKLAAKVCPELKFLVVESRGRWANALQVLKYEATDFPNVKVVGPQTDMRPIFAVTRALLVPSLWHESGARVIAEAHVNGIPVLGSDTGGSAELIGQGGMIFSVPQAVRDKTTEVKVTPEDLAPWLAALQRIWHEPAHYAQLCRAVEKEAVKHDISHNADRFIAAVAPLVLQSMGDAAEEVASPESA
jgi:glycosyltransferase involved in cell wall biosynthesis